MDNAIKKPVTPPLAKPICISHFGAGKGPYPSAPLFASLIVGYACAYEERGAWLL